MCGSEFMAWTFDSKVENKSNLSLEKLYFKLKEQGLQVELEKNMISDHKLFDIYLMEDENLFLITVTNPCLTITRIEQNNEKTMINEELLTEWSSIVIKVMNIVHAKFAVTVIEGLQFSRHFNFPLDKLYQIYYQQIDDIFPVISTLISKETNKKLDLKSFKKLIEKVTTFQMALSGIYCNSFLYVKENHYITSTFVDLILDSKIKENDENIGLWHLRFESKNEKILDLIHAVKDNPLITFIEILDDNGRHIKRLDLTKLPPIKQIDRIVLGHYISSFKYKYGDKIKNIDSNLRATILSILLNEGERLDNDYIQLLKIMGKTLDPIEFEVIFEEHGSTPIYKGKWDFEMFKKDILPKMEWDKEK